MEGSGEALEGPPQECDEAAKKNSKGETVPWRGRELRSDAIDGDVPGGS